jgi:hypothetical protein
VSSSADGADNRDTTHPERRVALASLDDKRLYRQEVAGTPVAITSEPGTPRGLRYADMDVSPDGRWIACVRESHEAADRS